MKRADKLPTDENLINSLSNDTIGRDKDIAYFVKLLSSITGNFTISIDDEWGNGKTFFVKQVKLVIDLYNNFIEYKNYEISEVDCKKVLSKMNEYISEDDTIPQVTVYYDAWDNDNDNDPILSIIYSILEQIDSEYSWLNKPDILTIISSIVSFTTGKRVDILKGNLVEEDILIEIKRNNVLKRKINEFLNLLLPEHGNRLIVFIDELDRCKPDYAVKLLERIKHYFTNDNITFVFSTNLSELQYTISRFYGNGFSSYKYLDRFFDLKITLPPARTDIFFKNGLPQEIVAVEKCVIEKFNFSLRDIVKYLEFNKMAQSVLLSEKKYFNNNLIEFCYLFVVPIAIGLNLHNKNIYYDFINGKGESILTDILSTSSVEIHLDLYLGNTSRTLDDKKKSIAQKYKNIFEKTTISDGVLTDSAAKKFVLRVDSLLSDYAEYNEREALPI